ncbi:hypothetical protein GM661_03765 [Iocasia frigidifontis]|uniref:Uncharacterized protein n=1 Tax=Iocasia fonsfrigidae TaxID=2682810 RepID=A0A8A7KG65_9FIRM|nr:hypothetical protein [Iocasia fonsfrigidae]QTL97154.1 hypothetical protein GM661_03765 [Iocasia fonsfrigidae]
MTELVLKTVRYILIFILIISCFFLLKTRQSTGQAVSNMDNYLDRPINPFQGEIKDDFFFQKIAFSNDILTNIASREFFVLKKKEEAAEQEEPEQIVKKNHIPEPLPDLVHQVEKQAAAKVAEKLIENPFILLGISVEKEGGLAILLNTKNKQTEIISKGDILEKFKIMSISKDCVVIEKEGQSFCLEFEK